MQGTIRRVERHGRSLHEVAEALRAELAPYCERIEIAGSVRRGKPDPKDVELLAVPKIDNRTAAEPTLFDMPHNLLDEYTDAQIHAERWQHRLDRNGHRSYGKRFKRITVDDGVAVDLFSVLPPASWGVLFVVRTGPWQFSKRCMTPHHMRGWLPAGCVVRDGAVWRDGERLEIATEREFFLLCGKPWVGPADRT